MNFKRIIFPLFILYSILFVHQSYGFDSNIEALEKKRCFDKNKIKFWCEDFSYFEKNEKILVQEIQIEALDSIGKKYSYGYGKAIEGALCQKDFSRISKFMKSNNTICFFGEGEVFIGDNEFFSRWTGLGSNSSIKNK